MSSIETESWTVGHGADCEKVWRLEHGRQGHLKPYRARPPLPGHGGGTAVLSTKAYFQALGLGFGYPDQARAPHACARVLQRVSNVYFKSIWIFILKH